MNENTKNNTSFGFVTDIDDLRNCLYHRLERYRKAITYGERREWPGFGFTWPIHDRPCNDPVTLESWRAAARELANTLDMIGWPT